MPKYNVHIVLTTNHPISQRSLKNYINDSLESWGGQYFPGDVEYEPDVEWKLVRKSRITAIAQRPMRRPKRADVVNLKQHLSKVR